jgi:hypothetical protein
MSRPKSDESVTVLLREVFLRTSVPCSDDMTARLPAPSLAHGDASSSHAYASQCCLLYSGLRVILHLMGLASTAMMATAKMSMRGKSARLRVRHLSGIA